MRDGTYQLSNPLFSMRYDRSMSSPYMKKSSSSNPTLSSAECLSMQNAPLTTSILAGLSHGSHPM